MIFIVNFIPFILVLFYRCSVFTILDLHLWRCVFTLWWSWNGFLPNFESLLEFTPYRSLFFVLYNLNFENYSLFGKYWHINTHLSDNYWLLTSVILLCMYMACFKYVIFNAKLLWDNLGCWNWFPYIMLCFVPHCNLESLAIKHILDVINLALS